MKIHFLVFLWILALVSCQKNVTKSEKYFDMDSLIDNQVKYLLQINASVIKTASVDSARDESTFIPNEKGWSNELAVFRHLEIINKPIYASAYENVDGVKDDNSNLTVRTLNAKYNVPVVQFKIFYQGDPGKLRRIEASIVEENTLYYTSRKFSLELEDHQGQFVLSKYQVRGVQKMILRDSVKFSISSSIIY